MKLVLDTNVLIAALISRGVCADLLEYCVSRHTVVSSEFIFAELQKHLLGKFKYSAEDVNSAARLLRSQVEMVTLIELDSAACRDPDDDSILATALAGNATCLVTGDKDLLVMKEYLGIQIVSPRDFFEYEIDKANN